MSNDPSHHRELERRFIEHVEQMLDADRLRIDTLRGRKPLSSFQIYATRTDKAVDLKRMMSEMGRPDRELQRRMPVGEMIEVELSQRMLMVFRQKVGRLAAACVSPARALLANETPAPLRKDEVERCVSQLAPGTTRAPATVVLLSTSGFSPEAREIAQRHVGPKIVLVEPNDAGGFQVHGNDESLNELFDPEAEQDKRQRIVAAIEEQQLEFSNSGVTTDRIAEKTQLPAQLIDAELKSYAKQHPGLVAKRLDGRMVLYREGSATILPPGGFTSMPMIDKIRALFTRRGEEEKKIAFLSERRTTLSQQRDRAYEEIAVHEQKEQELKEQFKNAGSELTRRRITSQMLQLRQDIVRRQQRLSVANQQINVIGTMLHNLELVVDGKRAQLPDSEEMATVAAAAEEMVAELQESSEMAATVGGIGSTGMSADEQALYEELLAETGTAPAKEPPTGSGIAGATETPAGQRIVPPITPTAERERKRSEPEAG